MVITGVGTAVPPQRYTQTACWDALQAAPYYERLTPRSRAILKKVLTGKSGIATRHLALNALSDAFDFSPDALHQRFVSQAPELAAQAGQRALAQAGVGPDQIGALLISTCTGYLCPGLTSYVAQRLDLPTEVLALDLVGQGCGAALPNLRTAEALLAAGRCHHALSICVEVCSAAFFLDDDPGVLVSACLFGDGAGAAVTANEPGGARPLVWKTAGSVLLPQEREQLRFEQQGGMLRNRLSVDVPLLAAQQAGLVLERVLAEARVGPEQISGWIFHPGGRDVLNCVRDQLALEPRALRWSEAVLRDYGNVSSASVYFVLEQALAEPEAPASGSYWWMSSFGAGFSCHGALLEVA